MDEKGFKEIIEFAIQREVESVGFYTRASQMVQRSGTKELFQDFAREEEKHQQKLEGYRLGKIVPATLQNIPDLKISDYLVDAELRAESSYAEILRIAMKREERSVKLYSDLKEKHREEGAVALFAFLVQEEMRHKYYLEKLYDEEILK